MNKLNYLLVSLISLFFSGSILSQDSSSSVTIHPSVSSLFSDGEILKDLNITGLRIRFERDFEQLKKAELLVKNLQHLVIHSYVIDSIPQFISEMESLVSLKIESAPITKLPEFMGGYENLVCLYLNNSNLESIPEEIFDNKKLVDITISGSLIQELPDKFHQLPNLENLVLSYNNLQSVPPSISSLSKLKFLHLEGNEIPELPDNLGNIKSLEILHLSSNKLENLPRSIKDLKNLKKLDLSNNYLKELPKGIWGLSKLESLNFKNNNIENLSKNIRKLTVISSLNLSDNKLLKLPSSLSDCSKLKILLCSGNKLSFLPISFSKFSRIKKISLDRNNFTEYPAVLSGIGIEELNISRNNITVLQENTAFIGELTATDNLIEKIPASFFETSSIINLDRNKVSSIEPFSTCKCKQLSLNDNLIKELPENLSICKIDKLSVNNNMLSSFPTDISSYKRLNHLDLSNNKLTILPEEMPNLSYLNLSNNDIDGNLDQLCDFQYLSTLFLANTKFTYIPECLFKNHRKGVVDLRGISFNSKTNLDYIINGKHQKYIKNAIIRIDSKWLSDTLYRNLITDEQIIKVGTDIKLPYYTTAESFKNRYAIEGIDISNIFTGIISKEHIKVPMSNNLFIKLPQGYFPEGMPNDFTMQYQKWKKSNLNIYTQDISIDDSIHRAEFDDFSFFLEKELLLDQQGWKIYRVTSKSVISIYLGNQNITHKIELGFVERLTQKNDIVEIINSVIIME